MNEGKWDQDLEEARLGGLSCKAKAWQNATDVAFIGKGGEPHRTQGVRTWRGVAVLEGAAAEALHSMCNRTSAYAGKVKIGEEERDVAAEVFITHMARRVATERSRRSGDAQVYVEFTGAGNL